MDDLRRGLLEGQDSSWVRLRLTRRKTSFSVFSRLHKRERERLKKEAKVLPVWGEQMFSLLE